MSNTTVVFPAHPALKGLLESAKAYPSSAVVVDDEYGFQKTYPELLGDLLQTRCMLLEQLRSSTRNGGNVLEEGDRNIGFMARSGYEFIVACLAVWAIGGTCMPMDPDISSELALTHFEKGQIRCVVSSKDCWQKVEAICNDARKRSGTAEAPKLIGVSCSSAALDWSQTHIQIDDGLLPDEDEACMIMGTSGSTGSPKLVLQVKRAWCPPPAAEPHQISLSYRACHWTGGAKSLIDPVICGRKVYVMAARVGGRARAEDVLEAIKQHGITDVPFFDPLMLRLMKDVVACGGNKLSGEERQRWSSYFTSLPIIRCSAGVVDQSTVDFWKDLTGLQVWTSYGSTELTCFVFDGPQTITGCLGKPNPDCQLKLSEGKSGEILVKVPTIFKAYIGDEEATKAAFDPDGFFKTGDFAEQQGDNLVYLGRMKTDLVFTGSHKFWTFGIESRILDLPYVEDACVLAIPVDETKQRCGVVLVFRQDSASPEPANLAKIRSDLSGSVAEFMLPTLARVLDGASEVIPRTAAGKPRKWHLMKDYFGSVDGSVPVIVQSRIEECRFPGPVEYVEVK
ncbi:uncharacterized protein UV8b_01145 [Ustilaginoidea virens]|uniref:AMP-dependent synthetase/ligase domain-containing protein n=1 Tax=Ustilaginoidea virens TaxID=1159556 RepID=A0A063C3V7_USTVR|nr:uncharacterized protein UV8b_01145 [Ustilaginoidea virens]QUC16904.1 hypothetical protein UV8b_01145 [Ustilaginoidea virens]GAO19023.1 hypothetical protein UVI_02036260 [Ustilaginoidea virens]